MASALTSALQTALETGITYSAYRTLIAGLLAHNQTTGPDQSEAMLAYTRINVQRMDRWDKTTVLSPETLEALSTLQTAQTWLILTEAWCGDAAQTLPVIQQVADASGGKIRVVLALRDAHPVLMDHFLTNGTRSIPKLIALDASGTVLWTWGPRPQALQDQVMANKALPEAARKTKAEMSEVIHRWYPGNKSIALQQELAAAILNPSNIANISVSLQP